MSRRVLLVDLSGFVFRAWYARGKHYPRTNTTRNIAVAGIERLRAKLEPEWTILCCDVPNNRQTFRHRLEPTYKSGRPDWSDDLVRQHERTMCELCSLHGVKSIFSQGAEAEDLIGTIVHWLAQCDPLDDVTIASADKDVLQLVGYGIVRERAEGFGPRVWWIPTNTMMGALEVFQKMGVWPSQIVDYLCLTGDSSDGVAGVPRIGETKARKLLHRYGTLADAMVEVMSMSAEACRLKPDTWAALRAGAETALRAKRLVELKTDMFDAGAMFGAPAAKEGETINEHCS